MNELKEKIRKAAILLQNHADEDFVSKNDAHISSIELLDIIHDFKIVFDILDEVKRAEEKHPKWPGDKVYAATIVSEENGELTRAALQFVLEGGKIEEVYKEAAHTAATSIRLIKNL